MTNGAKSYNIAAVRELLLAAFTPETLHRFCMDRRLFQPIIAQFGPEHGLDDMADQVIDYCRTQLLWDELLAAVEQVSPRQYARLEPQLVHGTHPSTGRAERPAGAETEENSVSVDPSAIARAVVTVLSLDLENGGAGLDAEAEGTDSKAAAKIHRVVKARFREEPDDFYAQTLQRFEEKPFKRKGTLQEVLEEVLESDRSFARSLNALLKEADEASAGAVFNVAVYGAQVGEIINIGELDGRFIIQEGRESNDG